LRIPSLLAALDLEIFEIIVAAATQRATLYCVSLLFDLVTRREIADLGVLLALVLVFFRHGRSPGWVPLPTIAAAFALATART
jgi:hypothetical protein